VQRRLRMIVVLLVGSIYMHLRHKYVNFLRMSSVMSGIIKRARARAFVCVC